VQAVAIRDDLLRLAHAPYYFRLAGLPEMAAGRKLWVEWIAVDELALSIEARFIGIDEDSAEDETDVEDAVEGNVEDATQTEAPEIPEVNTELPHTPAPSSVAVQS
jgi:hypothetical protein